MSKDNFSFPYIHTHTNSFQYYPQSQQFNHLHQGYFINNPFMKGNQNFSSHELLTIWQQPRYVQFYENPNIIQRISSIIKIQLPFLQNIMIKNAKLTQTCKNQIYDNNYQILKQNQQDQWLCKKCSFINYDWRRSCKKCNWLKQQFMPGPDDWKCLFCKNINYARRNRCNRCKKKKNNYEL